jgi:hypothetical protein
MTLDTDVVCARCAEIEQALDRLTRIRHAGRPAFLADADARDIACYRLLLAIEAALALWSRLGAAPETRPRGLCRLFFWLGRR